VVGSGIPYVMGTNIGTRKAIQLIFDLPSIYLPVAEDWLPSEAKQG